jgi:hypothetical protein
MVPFAPASNLLPTLFNPAQRSPVASEPEAPGVGAFTSSVWIFALAGSRKAEYAIAAAPCSSPERHLRLAKPYNFRPCGTTFELSQFWPGRRVIGGDVHRALSALLLTGAAIYTANTLLLGGKRKVMPNIRPLNRGYHSLRKALLEHARGERAAALSKALDEVNRLRNARRETHSQIKRMAELKSANWQTLLELRQAPSL